MSVEDAKCLLTGKARVEGLKHLITRQMCSSFILVLCLDDPDRTEFMDSWVGVKAAHMSD